MYIHVPSDKSLISRGHNTLTERLHTERITRPPWVTPTQEGRLILIRIRGRALYLHRAYARVPSKNFTHLAWKKLPMQPEILEKTTSPA